MSRRSAIGRAMRQAPCESTHPVATRINPDGSPGRRAPNVAAHSARPVAASPAANYYQGMFPSVVIPPHGGRV